MNDLEPNDGGCWICHKDGCDNFTIEWDSYFHWQCLKDYVDTANERDWYDAEIDVIAREFDLL